VERERLTRKLNSVGKEVFVRYYSLFRDYANGRITRRSALRRLVDEKVSNEDGASMRLSNAKVIFNEKGNCEALLIVQKSQRLSEQTIRTAGEILKQDCG
jgi:hypothetical protein